MTVEQPASLLWTSGWDSTFRLLSLVLLEKRAVQPYYLFMADRPSAPIELERQAIIRERLAAFDPAARALVMDTVTIDAADVPRVPENSERLYSLRKKTHIASQYRQLADMAVLKNLDRLELSLHLSAHADDLVCVLLEGNVEQAADGVFELKRNVADDDLELFRHFRFPLLNLSKPEMEAIARKHGFLDLLELSWFCNTPDWRMRPCGTCLPCAYAIREGMGRRVPWQGHVRHRLWKVGRPLKRAAVELGSRLKPKRR